MQLLGHIAVAVHGLGVPQVKKLLGHLLQLRHRPLGQYWTYSSSVCVFSILVRIILIIVVQLCDKRSNRCVT